MSDLEKPGNSAAQDETTAEQAGRLLLGSMLALAGISHLTFARKDFQAQVPDWVPMDKDTVVLLSGIVEVALGGSTVLLPKQKERLGWILAAFFVGVFPGNISQYIHHRNAFTLDTDAKRFIRLFFQPGLVAWALWSTGAWKALQSKKR